MQLMICRRIVRSLLLLRPSWRCLEARPRIDALCNVPLEICRRLVGLLWLPCPSMRVLWNMQLSICRHMAMYQVEGGTADPTRKG